MPVVDQLDHYPLVFESDFPNFSRDKLTRITLSGTTALARHTLPAIDAPSAWSALPAVFATTYALVGLLPDHQRGIHAPGCPDLEFLGFRRQQLQHVHEARTCRIFDLLDVDVVDLTGNHINDFGYDPLLRTLDYFESSGTWQWSAVDATRGRRARR